MAMFLNKMLENFIGDVDIDQPIYRIYSRSRLLELVKDQKNTLVRPRLWDDPFENAFLKCEARTDNDVPVSLETIREKWYGQCWTTQEDTDAMWRIYSHNKDGIRVKTTPRKLFSPLWHSQESVVREISCFIGKVEYLPRSSIEKKLEDSYVEHILGNPKNTAKTLLQKRSEFAHENEVRILFQDINSGNTSAIYKYDFKFNDVIEEVAIDPRAEADELDMLARYLQARHILTPVTQSKLYEFSPKILRFAPRN